MKTFAILLSVLLAVGVGAKEDLTLYHWGDVDTLGIPVDYDKYKALCEDPDKGAFCFHMTCGWAADVNVPNFYNTPNQPQAYRKNNNRDFAVMIPDEYPDVGVLLFNGFKLNIWKDKVDKSSKFYAFEGDVPKLNLGSYLLQVRGENDQPDYRPIVNLHDRWAHVGFFQYGTTCWK